MLSEETGIDFDKKRSFSDAFEVSAAFFRKNWKPFLKIMAITFLPLELLRSAYTIFINFGEVRGYNFTTSIIENNAGFDIYSFFQMMWVPVNYVVLMLLSYAILQAAQKESIAKINVAKLLPFVLKNFPIVIFSLVLSSVIVVVGFLVIFLFVGVLGSNVLMGSTSNLFVGLLSNQLILGGAFMVVLLFGSPFSMVHLPIVHQKMDVVNAISKVFEYANKQRKANFLFFLSCSLIMLSAASLLYAPLIVFVGKQFVDRNVAFMDPDLQLLLFLLSEVVSILISFFVYTFMSVALYANYMSLYEGAERKQLLGKIRKIAVIEQGDEEVKPENP